MIPNMQTFIYATTTICICSFKYFVLFLFPFRELLSTMKTRYDEKAAFVSRLESFEKTVASLLSEKNNNQANDSNTADNTNNDASTSNTSNSNAASKSANAKATSSPSPSSASVSAASSPDSSSHESLQATVKHVREQSIAAALDLSDKIDDLKQENQVLNAHIVALQNQLAEVKSEADNFSHTMANRIDILERYVQNDCKLEDQRKREGQEVQVLAQKNTDLINERINTVEDQLAQSFKELEDRRSKERQSFASTFESLRKRCDEFEMELDQQIQLTASQAKETATNSATIQETLASDALANLGKTVRDAINLCQSKLNRVEAEHEILQAVVEGTGEDIKTFHQRVVALETEFDGMREEVRNDLSEINIVIGSMEQDVQNIMQELAVPDDALDTDGNPQEATNDVTNDETF